MTRKKERVGRVGAANKGYAGSTEEHNKEGMKKSNKGGRKDAGAKEERSSHEIKEKQVEARGCDLSVII